MLSTDKILQERYQIISQIGHGGMSTVYEAQDKKRFNASVALKEIFFDLSDVIDSKQQDMLKVAVEREAKILAEVHHEVFPHVIEYFSENDKQYLVMELIQGPDLAELLTHRKTPFSLEEILKWSDQLLDALDYLHSYNPPIFHCDLKPQNLKLTSRGKIRLLNFGIAKSAEEHLTATITNQTFFAATLNYSPFEQVLRVLDPTLREVITQRYEEKAKQILEHSADARSDIYALGATLYHLSTAFMPTDALKRTLEVWSNKPDPLRKPHELNPSIPEEISLVFLKAMEVEQENRFASAVEMQQALNEATADVKRRERETAKKSEEEVQPWLAEVQHARWMAEQKQLEQQRLEQGRLEQERLERERRLAEQEPLRIETEQKKQAELIERQLQVAEIQPQYSEQERLRIEAEQVWLEQERQFAEQERLRVEARLPELHQPEAEVQQQIVKQHTSEPEKQLSEKENLSEIEFTATTQFSDGLTQQSYPAGIVLEEPKEGVPLYALPVETADLPFTLPQNRKISWLLPIVALIFLMFGGVILGSWFLQTSKTEEPNQTNPSQTEIKQTVTSSYTATPEPTIEATPEINETPPSTLSLEPIAEPFSRPSVVPKPAAPRVEKPIQQPRKTPLKPKKPVTIDDILNEQ
ncbi:MAG: protein kinase [Acidobacteriota bacterium]|nr:protein kinase [Acidobacteriota bacterium]